MSNKIFVLSKKCLFADHINLCLKESSLESETNTTLPLSYEPSVAIINLLNYDEDIEKQCDEVLESDIKKVILLENALDLYLNSKNDIPFSVYTKIIPKNKICEKHLSIEKKIVESKKKYVIFRVSEIYGLSTPYSLVDQLLFANDGVEFENSTHDFIYDGDVISAIEVSLRKEVSGIFDIASGCSIDLKDLVELIKKMRKIKELFINWKRKRKNIVFNCENFKFYKWEPLVNIETGLQTLLSFRRKSHVKLFSSEHS